MISRFRFAGVISGEIVQCPAGNVQIHGEIDSWPPNPPKMKYHYNYISIVTPLLVRCAGVVYSATLQPARDARVPASDPRPHARVDVPRVTSPVQQVGAGLESTRRHLPLQPHRHHARRRRQEHRQHGR